MKISQLIYRNLRKNLKTYYLYVFALIFSVALYFAFVTLQYDPSMDTAKGSIKGAAGLRAASVLLIAIVGVFLLYANSLFIKRRSKEIGLFQLVGFTKGKIFQILTVENLVLYFGSMLIGIFLGFASSKLFLMVIMQLTGIQGVAQLHFSGSALSQTLIVFAAIYCLIMLMNFIFIKRQSILALFQVKSASEGNIKKLSWFQMAIGILGLVLIIFGYYLSTRLFSGGFAGTMGLFFVMIAILGSVILGTYLFYKGSVSFIFYLIRKKKNGYLSIKEVLSLSSIMFRMKSNALLLTVITTVSALAIGLASLSYISYYSVEQTAEERVPNDFGIANEENAEKFQQMLDDHGINYEISHVDFFQATANITDILESVPKSQTFNPGITHMAVVSDEKIEEVNVSKDETVFVNPSGLLKKAMSFKDNGKMTLSGQNNTIRLKYKGMKDIQVLPTIIAGGGFPAAVVDKTVYQKLEDDIDPSIKSEYSTYFGFDVQHDISKANELFQQKFGEKYGHSSQLEISNSLKQNMGFTIFIVGFLALAFLITSGCILYFKQMTESEEEKPNYTILRKLGFTQDDLLKGIRVKQILNFGIPLVVGLVHSYFAVKSGWFLFGTELWTPMIAVMVLYAILYSIFGILSVQYYRKIIKASL
ncbi:FtsX-like permease family protein [Virgibacillus ihumii]|uniref:FtsX-like permease family protein n=1 Tax=Virgibacillus ihumii TaxID=2686091 RepID=UPI00157D37DA|nr:FtsX-like permease family protein [Virgibacillus ihumii]